MLYHKDQTKTLTGKEWREWCKNHDTFVMIMGYGYRLRARSIGGGVYEIYAKAV